MRAPKNATLGPLDFRHSPNTRLQTVSPGAVSLGGSVWAPRMARLRKLTLPSQFALLESSGRLNNFRRVIGQHAGPFVGRFFNDSDVYKWLEAASWSLMQGLDATLLAHIDETIALLEAVQEEDGYLNTWFSLERRHLRWTDLRDQHEMYCGGHLIQAAVAHHRATGSTRLLAIAQRFADLLCRLFGPAGEGRREAVDGHEEIEMALIELARCTGESRYLAQARYFIEARGHGLLQPYGEWGAQYFQDHQPLRKMKTLSGHAVRATYMACGATDLYLESGDKALLGTLENLWRQMTLRRMYITGGIGSRHEGEALGEDFELPNARAYTETCAAIGTLMWNQRMLAATAHPRHADQFEWVLFNGVLPGWSISGDEYFYVNPLEAGRDHRRQPWFETACCPPNVARTLAALPGALYHTSRDTIWVQLYADSNARLPLGEREIALSQRTRYPWDGEVELTVQTGAQFTLKLRIPGWCSAGATVRVNGEAQSEPAMAGTYYSIERRWRTGDVVQLLMPMPVRLWESHPRVLENTGRVAISRGPMLYCLESVDHPDADLHHIEIGTDAGLTPEFDPQLLGGVVVLRGTGKLALRDGEWEDALYLPARPLARPLAHPIALTAIPYFAWQNRGAAQMKVWIRRAEA